ncbi:MAG: adenylate/guanylate cyclase domain-containing protein [Spirochaetales bacterium]|nr:adenylate/guanylate cyclase domain-containing protein [Spirochaetales bacterium]
MRVTTKVPRYNSILFLLFPFFIYTVLNFSLVSSIFTEELVKFSTQLKPNIRSVIAAEKEGSSEFLNLDVPYSDLNQDEKIKRIYTRDYAGVIFVIFILILLFNLPIKKYFKCKRKNRTITNFTVAYTKFFINFSPEIIGGIVFLGSCYIHFSLYRLLKSIPQGEFMSRAVRNILIVSIFTFILVLLLVYLGQKFRVQTKYIQWVFSEEELKRRPNGFNFPGLRGRFFITTIFITFIPLAIVLFYIISSFTTISSLKDLSVDQFNFLLGDWVKIIDIFSDVDPRSLVLNELDVDSIQYIDSFGVMQLFLGIVPGLFFSLIYIIKIVSWSNTSILKPINELLFAMKKVAKGNLDSYTVVRSREETGELAYGFNQMLDGLKDRDRIKSLFGQYLSAEISEEILKGNVDLDGSMYQATILFADIRGFTSLSETITPHQTISFLNEYYNVMIDVIHQHGGIIDKFLGDGVLVLFGVPIASIDHADRAVSAAFKMREKLEEFNSKRESEGLFTIKIGIGIHTGEVIAGNVGNSNKLEYTVIGDTVNVASRIESLTKQFETELLIGETVYNNLSLNSTVKKRFEKLDGVTLRGKRVKVNLLKLIS